MRLIFVALITGLLPVQGMSGTPATFGQAKHVAREIYRQNPVSFYCDCQYQEVNKKLQPDFKSCGYVPRKNLRRASIVEWEHVVPAWWLGHQRQCWQHGGRKNCRKTDPVFRQAEADLMNLVPAIGEVNGDRSNFRFGMIEGEPRNYGQCDMEIDFKHRLAEPPPHRRGDIARIYFYMSKKYNLSISPAQEKLFQAWDKQDPVSEWELKKKDIIDAMNKPGDAAKLTKRRELTQ
jgi:deoxyribonuclease-1